MERECWLYDKARWGDLNAELSTVNWSSVLFGSCGGGDEQECTSELVDRATTNFSNFLLVTARKHIPVHTKTVRKSTHPWMDDGCLELVRRKREAEGTPEYEERLRECSQGILAAYNKYVEKTRKELQELPRASKKWWQLVRSLAQKSEKSSSIPPLKNSEGKWTTDACGKAELFLETFTTKYRLPVEQYNSFSELGGESLEQTSEFCLVRSRLVEKTLRSLQEDKATGPDKVSARLLKHCAKNLCLPVAKLTRAILKTGHWPEEWRTHWVVPLYKKRSVYNPENYRGIHLSSQLLKVVERVLAAFFVPFLKATGAFGPNQYAYRKKRGCKDLMALNALKWLAALSKEDNL